MGVQAGQLEQDPASPGEADSFLATPRGRVTLLLLCAVAFLDFVDASIVNVALPSIHRDLGIGIQALQWVPSGYLLTYGGFMLLGGRAADLIGRRSVLLGGTALFAVSCLVAGAASASGVLIGARLAQGVGAALMLPAALSILTTSFREGAERNAAFAAWGGMAGLGSAVGVLAGGVLTQAAGWRWVFFVNPPVCAVILVGTIVLIRGDTRRIRIGEFDVAGAILGTAGVLLLVFALVRAPQIGWGSGQVIGAFAGAAGLLIAFVLNEARSAKPLLPLAIFRTKGLAAADLTQLIAVAAFIAMFFFLTLYMQDVLGYSPIHTGLSYLPVTVGVGIAAGTTPKLLGRFGTRSVLVAGALVAAGGVYLLARAPVHGSYLPNLLPGMVIMSLGLGAEFVAATTAANAGVAHHQAGLAAALINASQQVGGALGLAIFSAIATAHTNHLLRTGTSHAHALSAGFDRALLAACGCLIVASVIALRTKNTRGDAEADVPASVQIHTEARAPS